jgi:hypothetical protein
MVTSVHHKINPKKNPGPVFLIFGEFSQPGEKKKGGLANPTKGFLKFSKKSSDFKENSFEVVKIFWRIWPDL